MIEVSIIQYSSIKKKEEEEEEEERIEVCNGLEGIEARYDINYHLGNEVRTYRDAKVEWMVKLSEFDVVLERTMVHNESVYVREREREREREMNWGIGQS